MKVEEEEGTFSFLSRRSRNTPTCSIKDQEFWIHNPAYDGGVTNQGSENLGTTLQERCELFTTVTDTDDGTSSQPVLFMKHLLPRSLRLFKNKEGEMWNKPLGRKVEEETTKATHRAFFF